tara:strand:+ start:26 stop:424 length:399 start_codon:yes stop_codon:yes gene_type:complete
MKNKILKKDDNKEYSLIDIELNDFNDDDEYNNILKCIEYSYTNKKKLFLSIETKKLTIENVSLNKVYQFSIFLKNYKKKDVQYLKKTTIHIYNNTIYDVLYNLFTFLTKPIAHVVIILHDNNEIKLIKDFFP